MKTDRNNLSPIECNAFSALIDNSEASRAAERLYRGNENGVRFCSENREVLPAREAKALDSRATNRRGQAQNDRFEADEFGNDDFRSEIGAFADNTETDFDDDLDFHPDNDDNYVIDLGDDDMSLLSDDDELSAVSELFDEYSL